jgi:hypothetical protein
MYYVNSLKKIEYLRQFARHWPMTLIPLIILHVKTLKVNLYFNYYKIQIEYPLLQQGRDKKGRPD